MEVRVELKRSHPLCYGLRSRLEDSVATLHSVAAPVTLKAIGLCVKLRRDK